MNTLNRGNAKRGGMRRVEHPHREQGKAKCTQKDATCRVSLRILLTIFSPFKYIFTKTQWKFLANYVQCVYHHQQNLMHTATSIYAWQIIALSVKPIEITSNLLEVSAVVSWVRVGRFNRLLAWPLVGVLDLVSPEWQESRFPLMKRQKKQRLRSDSLISYMYQDIV